MTKDIKVNGAKNWGGENSTSYYVIILYIHVYVYIKYIYYIIKQLSVKSYFTVQKIEKKGINAVDLTRSNQKYWELTYWWMEKVKAEGEEPSCATGKFGKQFGRN